METFITTTAIMSFILSMYLVWIEEYQRALITLFLFGIQAFYLLSTFEIRGF